MNSLLNVCLWHVACTRDESTVPDKAVCKPLSKSLFLALAVYQDLSAHYGWLVQLAIQVEEKLETHFQ